MSHKSDALEDALQRSQLSSTNQMEMLTFRLTDGQLYGINVFKIMQLLECPQYINKIPQTHPAIKGIISFREHGINVIDISEAIGLQPIDYQNEFSYLVVCEYNKQLNAFLIQKPETLLTRGWDQISKPEGFNAPSIVAIAYADNDEMILLLDIETVLADIVGMDVEINQEIIANAETDCRGKRVMLVDDSSSAMMLMRETMKRLGVIVTEFDSAVKALAHLEEHLRSDSVPEFDLIISDIEMPGMDGFTLTRQLRTMSELSNTPIALHSSMSNPTNRTKAEEAGANEFIPKFNPNELSDLVVRLTGE
ncbi:MAG: chemotaxis protein [Thermodesulfobacteriota bacterium]|nr:chemotaxis protein [Thermodesulfobacteriota bacterium]